MMSKKKKKEINFYKQRFKFIHIYLEKNKDIQKITTILVFCISVKVFGKYTNNYRRERESYLFDSTRISFALILHLQ